MGLFTGNLRYVYDKGGESYSACELVGYSAWKSKGGREGDASAPHKRLGYLVAEPADNDMDGRALGKRGQVLTVIVVGVGIMVALGIVAAMW